MTGKQKYNHWVMIMLISIIAVGREASPINPANVESDVCIWVASRQPEWMTQRSHSYLFSSTVLLKHRKCTDGWTRSDYSHSYWSESKEKKKHRLNSNSVFFHQLHFRSANQSEVCPRLLVSVKQTVVSSSARAPQLFLIEIFGELKR